MQRPYRVINLVLRRTFPACCLILLLDSDFETPITIRMRSAARPLDSKREYDGRGNISLRRRRTLAWLRLIRRSFPNQTRLSRESFRPNLFTTSAGHWPATCG